MPDEPSPTSECRIVLVDSRDDRRELMRRVVEGEDATAILVGEANSKAAALTVVDEQRGDAVILDVHMPVSEGLATIAALRERYPQLGIVVCSFDLDPPTMERALAQGADRCLTKPVSRVDLRTTLRALRLHERAPDDSSRPPLSALPAIH